MTIKSYAKVNLFLKVYPRKNNEKLHKIYSFVQLNKEFYDVIKIQESKHDCIDYYSDDKRIIIDDCIISRTLTFLRTHYQIKKKYKIEIYKNIPIGSGLGGASSNAATVIKYILKNEKIKINNYDGFENLGSDISFFLSSYSNAIVSNYGEKIKKAKNPKILYKIILVGIKCSTKLVYEKFDLMIDESKLKSTKNQLKYLYDKNIDLLENDLEKACFNLYPNIEKSINFFQKNFKPLITGSGSTIILFKRNQNEKQCC